MSCLLLYVIDPIMAMDGAEPAIFYETFGPDTGGRGACPQQRKASLPASRAGLSLRQVRRDESFASGSLGWGIILPEKGVLQDLLERHAFSSITSQHPCQQLLELCGLLW